MNTDLMYGGSDVRPKKISLLPKKNEQSTEQIKKSTN